MATVAEVRILVKHSPKRENWLGKIYENIESEDSKPLKKLKKLSRHDGQYVQNVLRESLITLNCCWNFRMYV